MSPSLLEIFVADARKYIDRLRESIQTPAEPDADSIRRWARRLNHAASLAEQDRVASATAALQQTAVEILAGRRPWSAPLAGSIARLLGELETVVDSLPGSDPDAEGRLELIVSELSGGDGSRPERSGEAVADSEGDADDELQALINDLGDAVDRLQNDPRDREPLKAMLRRIRTLRDQGVIQPVSAPDKALTAVEELILQIADLNATVGPGYLTVFRHAREVLERLRDGEERNGAAPAAGADVDELKDKVMEKARRARQVIWVSELFYEEGAPIIECPVALERSGSIEKYFLGEAGERLAKSEALRGEMLEADSERMRLAGESLANTLRHLRERAVAFNHAGFGRVVRRAAAAMRAQLVRPPPQVRSLAEGLGGVFGPLRMYLEAGDPVGRQEAIATAEASLQQALAGHAEPEAEQEQLTPEIAMQRALELRTRIDARLGSMRGEGVNELKRDLEVLFELLSYYLTDGSEGGQD